MISTPSPERPLLVGLLVDVSGSMTSSSRNASGPSQNRLQGFQSALGELASKATVMSVRESGDRLRVFAYGFGFGNPLGALFGGASSPPVRDLLEGATSASSTIGISDLANRWERYKSHVEGLAIKMFGASPMLDGVRAVSARFAQEAARINPCGTVLFILSDGEPTDSTPDQVVNAVTTLRDAGTLVVSCYVTDHDITSPRYLYGEPQSNWSRGAHLMFDVASPTPLDTPFSQYLQEHHWHLEPSARLFTQVNQSEVLAEFLQVIVSPLRDELAGTPSVFVSYSHMDSRWRDRLQVHLKPLVRDGTIDLWDDQRIQTGQEWRSEIEAALARSKVAIMLVSADFLASDFIATEELPKLLAAARTRGAKILPVVVGPARYDESPLGKFQSVNPPQRPLSGMGKQDAEGFLVSLSREVESALKGDTG